MKQFIKGLSYTDYPKRLGDLYSHGEKLFGATDTLGLSFLWFRVHLASDWPELTGLTKKYFVIYSTDHKTYGSSWGVMDDLDCSGFQEIDIIWTTGTSPEVPTLYRVDSYDIPDSEVVHINYHPAPPWPQNTRAWSSSGGSLSNIGDPLGTNPSPNWTFRDIQFDQSMSGPGYTISVLHTGYCKVRKRADGDYEARHLLDGDSPQKRCYSYSPDGRTWTRGELIPFVNADDKNGVNYDWEIGTPDMFRLNGVWYSIGNFNNYIVPEDARPVGMLKWDDNQRNPEFVKWIGLENRFVDLYITDDKIHIYGTNNRNDGNILSYYTIDII